jgi:hypothetical protein
MAAADELRETQRGLLRQGFRLLRPVARRELAAVDSLCSRAPATDAHAAGPSDGAEAAVTEASLG